MRYQRRTEPGPYCTSSEGRTELIWGTIMGVVILLLMYFVLPRQHDSEILPAVDKTPSIAAQCESWGLQPTDWNCAMVDGYNKGTATWDPQWSTPQEARDQAESDNVIRAIQARRLAGQKDEDSK